MFVNKSGQNEQSLMKPESTKRKFKGKKTNKTSTFSANAFQFQPEFPANLQPPFRDPQSWFTGFPVYNNQFKQFSTGGNQRKWFQLWINAALA